MTALIAATYYPSWSDWLFSRERFVALLGIGMMASAVLLPILAYRQQLSSRYFSRVFALTLCPFILSAVITALHIYWLNLDVRKLAESYLEAARRSQWEILIFGGALSVFLILIYSAIRAARRARRRGACGAKASL